MNSAVLYKIAAQLSGNHGLRFDKLSETMES